MARIAGLLISGIACRIYGAAVAVWIALEAARIIGATLGNIAAVWPG